MVTQQYALDWYQWDYRPKDVRRPGWFIQWPGGAQLAVTIKIMLEWESLPRPGVTGGRGMPAGSHHKEDYLALSIREYGFKAGVWRLMDMLDRQGVKATVMMSGLSAELWPDTAREIKRQGHEIATHGWDQAIHPPTFKSREEEREALLKSVAAIEKAAGERPYGYMSPGPRPTPNTLEILAEEGFLWDGDYNDADIPYIINVKGRKLVSVGYVRPAYTDNDVLPLGLAGALQQLKDEFDAHYEESARHPMKFIYSMHAHNGGRPGAARVAEKFIEYAKGQPGVWFARCLDMANFWLEHEGR
ncbi:MAG: polysaccharide deacetylase family protein [Chloroflexi bacterium]|nr:polysaccharide deacetylase family protein [Chloroflexota bacterium]